MNIGVDLNRNYAFEFGQDEEDEDECGDTFRGPRAFSEKETLAIKNLVESEPEITSALNLHAFGNLWIQGTNYMKDKNSYPIALEKTIVNFYDQFKNEVQKMFSNVKFGNAIDLVDYKTSGEASDWMLGEKKIIAYSPELGSTNPDSRDFYPPKSTIVSSVNENFEVIKMFLQKNTFNMIELSFGYNQEAEFLISFYNNHLANIYEPDLIIEDKNSNFVSKIVKVYAEYQLGEKTEVEFDIEKELNLVKIHLKTINRLQKCNLIFVFECGKIENRNISLDLVFKLSSGFEFWRENIKKHTLMSI